MRAMNLNLDASCSVRRRASMSVAISYCGPSALLSILPPGNEVGVDQLYLATAFVSVARAILLTLPQHFLKSIDKACGVAQSRRDCQILRLHSRGDWQHPSK